MSRYRKRPVVITAEQLTVHAPYQAEQLAEWCGGKTVLVVRNYLYPEWTLFDNVHPDHQRLMFSYAYVIDIPTLEGTMRAMPGDYIIEGVSGEFYPCKPDIFEQTYELVEDDDDSQDNTLPGPCSLLRGKRTE